MAKKILLAYSSAAGSTAEIAQEMAKVMREAGADVTVEAVEAIKSLDGYDSVVVGTAVRATQILSKTKSFMRKFKQPLQQKKVAYFVVCMAMSTPDEKTLAQVEAYLKPMMAVKAPVAAGKFAGCMNPAALTGFWKFAMKNQKYDDKRDWDLIRAWAKETLALL